MSLVTFTGVFDNGHSFYEVDSSIRVDTSKDYLTKEEISHIVSSLKRADRKLHGRGYRGEVISFQVSTEEFDKQYDNGNVFLEGGDSEYRYRTGYEWLSNFYASKEDIERATSG